MRYLIDGLFLAQNLTGIQRYAYEICNELDKIITKDELGILVPEYVKEVPAYTNIKVIRFGNNKSYLWEQIDYKNYLKHNKLNGLCLTNEIPILYPKGIVCLHDISYRVNPHFFRYAKGRLSVIWHSLNYYFAAKSSMKILTVSNFSRSEIERVYHVKKERISVIHNSWQHMNNVEESQDIFTKYPFLEDGKFYFSMSTLAANKNFKWILYAAKQNPNDQFDIAGGGKLRGAAEALGFVDLPNVHFLGYVSDSEAKALMKRCKAFLFPTLYEGFGIPPLEAVACGCKQIIVSDIPCMHEIYGEYANYINPLNYENIELKNLKMIEDISDLLKKYSWSGSAKKLYEIIKEESYGD